MDSAIALELRKLHAELHAELRRLIVAAVAEGLATGKLTPPQRRVVVALGELFGDGGVFESREIRATLSLDVAPRPALRAALQEVGAIGADGVGRALLAIVRAGGLADGWRLCRVPVRSGRAKWMVQRNR